ncbi:MAG: PLP-dependent aminotransferase family protein [Bryobacteraceae bacterium]|jgi:2-aminoadipate transaminase
MLPAIHLDPSSNAPLYRQLSDAIKELIGVGRLERGGRLPATRELAGILGLNRTTVSAAYALLESEGLVRGHVGRGSFVLGETRPPGAGLNWEQLLPALAPSAPAAPDGISFSSSCPAEDLFPMEAFRRSCEEVLAGTDASAVLQLGSPSGYAPLRHHLLGEARREGVARPGDDLIVTNGCQQALDLIARVLVRPGDAVIVEDPVYPGLKNVLLKAGAQLVGVPAGVDGIDIDALERAAVRSRPRLIVTTPDFQNPTGGTLPAEARRAVLRIARLAGCVLVENDIYGELRYEGEAAPAIKQIDETGDTVLLRSFSKLTFPGLRVGWTIAPKALVARMADAKHLADLHSDQLSQAVLLRFAVSGRLKEHRARILAAGAERLAAVLEACQRWLPAGSHFTRPQGGMNLWVRLPEPLDAGDLLARAQREGVSYLPGRYFEVSRREPGGLRLSFAALPPEKIRAGLAILGKVFSSELARARLERHEPAPAVV